MDDFDPAYIAYIKSDRWKRKCTLYWMTYGRFCKACGKRSGPLMVHHMTYDHLGNEPLADLMGLCPECHREVHKSHRATGRRKDLRVVTLEYIKLRRTKNIKRA